MKNKLFLDDIRWPPDNTWHIVRSFDEFVDYMLNNPVPEVISFDHDLGENSLTGLDCAKWLVESNIKINDFYVHSANLPGVLNIRSLMQNWKDFNGVNND